MRRRSTTVRNMGIAMIVIGLIVAAGSLLLPMPSVSNQLMSLSLRTGEPPPPSVTRCASPLSTGSPYAIADAGTNALDCAAIISRRRWLAGTGGALTAVGIVVLVVSRMSRRRQRVDEPDDATSVAVSS